MGKLKFAVGDEVIVNLRGLSRFRGRMGRVIEIGPVKGEYGVKFADGREPSLVYVEAMRLDRLERRDERLKAGWLTRDPTPT
jgi:hypothetical protein